MAEKFQSVITRGVFNTRQKDFYDIYVLMNFKKNDIDDNNLKQAIYNTFKKRETIVDIENIKEVSDILKEDEVAIVKEIKGNSLIVVKKEDK